MISLVIFHYNYSYNYTYTEKIKLSRLRSWIKCPVWHLNVDVRQIQTVSQNILDLPENYVYITS
jgi:hypothetical protein